MSLTSVPKQDQEISPGKLTIQHIFFSLLKIKNVQTRMHQSGKKILGLPGKTANILTFLP